MPLIDPTPAFDDKELNHLLNMIIWHLGQTLDAQEKHNPVVLCEGLDGIAAIAEAAKERFCEVHRSLFPK